MVLRQCPAAEFLVECTIWTELVISLEWSGTNMASDRLNRGILHRCMGLLSSRHWFPFEKTFVDFPRFCNWSWGATMVSNALGNNVDWHEFTVG